MINGYESTVCRYNFVQCNISVFLSPYTYNKELTYNRNNALIIQIKIFDGPTMVILNKLNEQYNF